EALEGLARFARQSGDTPGLRTYLDRLRKINPVNPAIAAIERMHVLTAPEIQRLDEAGRLTMQHKPDDAMKIYRDVFGDAPPSGKWAEAFYEAEAASSGGQEKAVAHLRALCGQDQGNEVYRFWLARALTLSPATRIEGLRLLETIQDPGAVERSR